MKRKGWSAYVASLAICSSVAFAAAIPASAAIVPAMEPAEVIPVNYSEAPATTGFSTVQFLFKGGGEIGVEALNKQVRASLSLMPMVRPCSRSTAQRPVW